MFKTKYATEQRKGEWWALKCTTLFGITIWTEYIDYWGQYTKWWKFNDNHLKFCTRREAISIIESFKKAEECRYMNTKKQWVE